MMRSATAFLPDSMITFMNLDRSTEPNFGSGRMSRLGTSRRRGISHLSVSVGASVEPAPRRSPGRKAARTCHLLGGTQAPPRHAPRRTGRGVGVSLGRPDQAFFGRFAPYLERDCLRSLTPCR